MFIRKMTIRMVRNLLFDLDRDTVIKATHQALFRVDLISNVGLYNGKMGMIILFFHYSNYSGESEYNELAEGLLMDLLENLSYKESVDLATGLAWCSLGYWCICWKMVFYTKI